MSHPATRYLLEVADEQYVACASCANHFLALNPSATGSPATGGTCDLRYDGRVTCDDRPVAADTRASLREDWTIGQSPKLSRREQMAARAIARKRIAATLDPNDSARYRTVKRLPLAATTPEAMRANPNDGKRHVARMMPTEQDIRRMIEQSRQDSPVNVAEHRIGKRGKMYKRPSAQYTRMRSDFR